MHADALSVSLHNADSNWNGNNICKVRLVYTNLLRLPYVVSIDFWQYKVEVEVDRNNY